MAEGFEATHTQSESPESKITHLTWTGHEFLDSARENTIWNQAKGLITTQLGGAAITVKMIEVGKALKISLGFT